MPEARHITPRSVPVLALLAAVLAVAAVPRSAAAEAEYTIKFGTVAPEGTPWSEQLTRIGKRIEKESNGRIDFKIFTGGVLGGEIEMVRMLRRGRIQGFGGSLTAVAEGASMPALNAIELPYLFRSYAEADHILDDVIHDDMMEGFREKGFFLAQWHENGWRSFASKGGPIHTVEDLRKLKMRSQESPIHLAMYETLGVQASSIPTPEVLSALQTGLVDGFDNTALFSAATGWFEAVKSFTLSEHIYQPAAILYNAKFWDDLPADLKAVVLGDVAKETAEGRASVRAIQDELVAGFKDSGIEVYAMTDAEKKAFQEATRPVHERFADEIGRPLLEKIYAALAAMRAGS